MLGKRGVTPRTMTRLYIDPIKDHDVIQNVTSSDVTNVVDTPQTSVKPTNVNACSDNSRFVEILIQTNSIDNLIDEIINWSHSKSLVVDHVYDMSKTIDVPVVETLKETLTLSNVAPDVVTSLAQSDDHIKTTQDNTHEEPEPKSASESKNSQQKMVTENGEEKKVTDSEGYKIVTGVDVNSSEDML